MRLADSLIDRLTPRLDPQQAGFIREDADGGDWDEAIDLLVATLVKRQNPITREEHNDLRSLVEDFGWPTQRLDNLNVVPESVEEAVTDE